MKKRRVKLRFKLVMLAIFLVYAGVAIYGQQMKIVQLQKEHETLVNQAEQVQTELERLQHKKDYMLTNDYIENSAREKFGLVYEGEIIIEPKNNSTE